MDCVSAIIQLGLTGSAAPVIVRLSKHEWFEYIFYFSIGWLTIGAPGQPLQVVATVDNNTPPC
jgi:hypothetical protein